MSKLLTLGHNFLYSTVKISAFNNDVKIGTGTGFFMFFSMSSGDSLARPAVVTNKHVVQSSNKVVLILHVEEQGLPSGKFIELEIDLTPESVFDHPNQDVDLCAILISAALKKVTDIKRKIFLRQLDWQLIPDDDDWKYFDAIEEVIMVGYPKGISDEVNHLPIVRKGITATSLEKPYNGKPEFMVDMACFPGSSGSPVFIYDRNGYMNHKDGKFVVGESRIYFLGILYSGPISKSIGKLILSQSPSIAFDTMMHLGYVIRSDQLRILDEDITNRLGRSSK